MKTGEGKTLVATLPVYLNALAGQRRAPGHGQRLPGRPRRRVDGPGLRVPGPDGGRSAEQHGAGSPAARPTRPTSPTAPTPSSASTTCATTWCCAPSSRCSAATPSASWTRWTPSSSTRRGRRSSSPAPASARPRPTTTSPASPAGSRPARARRGADYEVDEKKRTVAITEDGLARVEQRARHRQHLRGPSGQLVNHLHAGPAGRRRSSSATSTTWCRTARSRSSTSSPAASSRGAGTPRGCTRPSRPKRASRSRKRTRRSPPSPCRTTSACTRRSPA